MCYTVIVYSLHWVSGHWFLVAACAILSMIVLCHVRILCIASEVIACGSLCTWQEWPVVLSLHCTHSAVKSWIILWLVNFCLCLHIHAIWHTIISWMSNMWLWVEVVHNTCTWKLYFTAISDTRGAWKCKQVTKTPTTNTISLVIFIYRYKMTS